MPGFAFWGLFLVFGLIVFLYLAWMVWVERSEEGEGAPPPGEGPVAASGRGPGSGAA